MITITIKIWILIVKNSYKNNIVVYNIMTKIIIGIVVAVVIILAAVLYFVLKPSDGGLTMSESESISSSAEQSTPPSAVQSTPPSAVQSTPPPPGQSTPSSAGQSTPQVDSMPSFYKNIDIVPASFLGNKPPLNNVVVNKIVNGAHVPMSVQQCAEECTKESKCQYYGTNANGICALRSGIPFGGVTTTFNDPSFTKTFTYDDTFFPNYYLIPGNKDGNPNPSAQSVQSNSVADCNNICKGTKNCIWSSYNKGLKTCWTHGTVPNTNNVSVGLMKYK
jgi:hypothetical protein